MGIVRELKKYVHNAIRAYLAQYVDTHVPCQVISYNATDNTVNLQPCIDAIRVFDPDNMQTVTLPPINDVPVRQFGSGSLWMTAAPQAGAYGVLHVAKHRLDSWLDKGGQVAPTSAILFNKSDGFFEPGICTLMVNDAHGKLGTAIATDEIGFRTRDGTKKAVFDGTKFIVNSTDDSAALTSKVDARLGELIDLLTGNGTLPKKWVVLGNDGGAALQTAAKAIWTLGATSMASTESDDVKCDS